MTDLLQFWTQHTPIFSILNSGLYRFYFGAIGQSGIRFSDHKTGVNPGVVVSVIPLASWA